MSELCKNCACENVCGITHTPEDKACEFYKAEALTELEKIKEEMLTELYVNRVTKEALINIVDNHISELKGKQE